MSEILLETVGLKKYFKTSSGALHAVDNVSFSLEKGEIFTILGANAAGKSSTLSSISGIVKPASGSIRFKGEEIAGNLSYKTLAKGIVHVPEGREVFPALTVQENLEMGAYTRSGSGVDEDLEKVFAQFPRLKERRRQVAGTLSGGEQQMLAIGRALMSSPKLLMLDEPSMGLAPILVEQIFDIIRRLHENGTTILLVEQNAQMALSVADRAYVMETGSISLSGTGRELAESDQVKKAYLGG